jgi:uncharacterized protein (TIGR02996 family)
MVNDGEALLATILADPADDAPRLVYADWLEEHGETERAEFIRLQIADPQSPDTPWDKFPARQRELWGRNSRRWISIGNEYDQLEFLAVGIDQYRRGFIERIRVSWALWFAHADRVRRFTPLQEVQLTTFVDTSDLMLCNLVNVDIWPRARSVHEQIAPKVTPGSALDADYWNRALLQAWWPGIDFTLPPPLEIPALTRSV